MLGEAIISPAFALMCTGMTTMTAEWFGDDEKGTAIGVGTIAYPVGIMFGLVAP